MSPSTRRPARLFRPSAAAATLLPATLLLALPVFCAGGCAKEDVPVEEAADLGTDGAAPRLDQAAVVTRTVLSGSISRTARPMSGGKGDLYVAVFEGNPVVDAKNARLLGQQLITAVDYSGTDVRTPYRIEGILLAQRPTQVLAFLDDNHTVSSDKPGPDAGDLVTLDGLGGIKVTLVPDGENHLDLVLNAVIPKL